MILLILPVLSSFSSLSGFQSHPHYCPSTWFLSLCLVMIRDSHIVDFPFLFSLCFVHFFIYENDYLSSDMLQRKHIQAVRPQTGHSFTICPSFFSFLLPFSFFSFFSFFLLLLLFFVQPEKKKDHFFSSLAVLVLDQSQGGLENSGRHAEDSLDRLLFVFIFQKDFAFVLQFIFLLLS